MNDPKVHAKLSHFSADTLPCGELPLASLPPDVADAVHRIRQSLQSAAPSEKHAARALVEDPHLAVDADLDAPVWSIEIDCENGNSVSFQVTANCGRPDTQTLVRYLEEHLPELPRDRLKGI